MRSCPFFLLSLIVLGCNQPTTKIIDRYSSGQVKTEFFYPNKNDTSTYTYKGYYNNGRIEYEGQVVSNVFVGEKKVFFENGRLQRVEKLSKPTPRDATKYDCYIINFHPDGTRKSEYQYVNDKINGLTIDYDSTGNKAKTAEYIDGKMNGREIHYFPDGKVKSEAFFKNDTLRGFDIYFKENGDTLKWFYDDEYGLNGVFYKKWLDNGFILTGEYGDTWKSYVVWKWWDKTNKVLKRKTAKSKNDEYIAPE